MVNFIRSAVLGALTVWCICNLTQCAQGQIFVTLYGDGQSGQGSVGEYSLSGTTITAPLITGLSRPIGIAVSGDKLFVVNGTSIDEYTTSGTLVHSSLITGLQAPTDIIISGTDLYVSNAFGSIGHYTTSGATVNASLISGLFTPLGIAISDGNLFVVNHATQSGGNSYVIGEYTLSGAVVNASLSYGADECQQRWSIGAKSLRSGCHQGERVYDCWRTTASRTSNLFSCQDFGEEVGVPAGDLHFAADAFFHRVML